MPYKVTYGKPVGAFTPPYRFCGVLHHPAYHIPVRGLCVVRCVLFHELHPTVITVFLGFVWYASTDGVFHLRIHWQIFYSNPSVAGIPKFISPLSNDMAAGPNDIKIALLETDRPVMSVSDLMEVIGSNNVTVRETARAMVRVGEIEQIKVGSTTAFYLPEGGSAESESPDRVKA